MAKIFYFTGTGNCYSVAKQLGKKLDADLIAVTKYLDNPVEIKDSVVGIVTPVYSTDLPPIVVEFIEKIKITNAKYVFCVATMAATVWSESSPRVLNSFPLAVQVITVSHKASELLPGGILTA